MGLIKLLGEKQLYVYCLRDMRERVKNIENLKGSMLEDQELLGQVSEKLVKIDEELQLAREKQDSVAVVSLVAKKRETEKEMKLKKDILAYLESRIKTEQKEYQSSLSRKEQLEAKWKKSLSDEEINSLLNSTCDPDTIFKDFVIKILDEKMHNPNFRYRLPEEYRSYWGMSQIPDCHLHVHDNCFYIDDSSNNASSVIDELTRIASYSDIDVVFSKDLGGMIYEEEWINLINSNLSPTLKNLYARSIAKAHNAKARAKAEELKAKAEKYSVDAKSSSEFEMK